MKPLLTAITVLLAASSTVSPARANWLSDDVQWINTLKCRDVFDNGKINNDNASRYALWLTGFMQGISTVPPRANYGTSVSGFMETLGPYCDKNPSMLIVHATTDGMSFEYNAAHSKERAAVDLLDPLLPEP